MYTPQPLDQVRIGRHGAPMTVLTVYPASLHAQVRANDGAEFFVEWDEMALDDWTREVCDWESELDGAIR